MKYFVKECPMKFYVAILREISNEAIEVFLKESPEEFFKETIQETFKLFSERIYIENL